MADLYASHVISHPDCFGIFPSALLLLDGKLMR